MKVRKNAVLSGVSSAAVLEDLEIGVALLQVEPAQQLAIEGDLLRVIFVRGRQEAIPGGLSRSLITSRSRPSPKAWLPTNTIRLISVRSPSLISNTTVTRFWSSLMILGSTLRAEPAALGVVVQQLLPVLLRQGRG